MNNGLKYLKGAFLVAGGAVMINAAQAQIAWPKTTRENKPWTRWWWEGSAVNEKDLTWNLEQYQQAGLGGVELTPIYGVEGQEKNFVSFLSPRWMELFRYTLKESKRLGLGVDLANATGWPFGGPWVIDADASKTMEYKTYSLKAGAQLKEPVQFIRKGLVRTANNKEADLALIKNRFRPIPIYRNWLWIRSSTLVRSL